MEMTFIFFVGCCAFYLAGKIIDNTSNRNYMAPTLLLTFSFPLANVLALLPENNSITGKYFFIFSIILVLISSSLAVAAYFTKKH